MSTASAPLLQYAPEQVNQGQYYQNGPQPDTQTQNNIVTVEAPSTGRHWHIGTLIINFLSWFFNITFIVGLIGTIIAGAMGMKPTWMFPTFLPIMIISFIFRIFLFILQCCSMRNSTTAGFLRNTHDGSSFFDYIQSIKNGNLKLGFTCRCFHYETRTRTVSSTVNGKTSYRTETYTVRVDTYSETEMFVYKNCVDKSDDVDPRDFHHPLIQVTMKKEFTFGDPKTEFVFNNVRGEFVNRNRFRDSHFEEWIVSDLDGFREEAMYCDETRRPACFNLGIWNILSVLSCSWPFMIWLDSISAHSNFKVKKVIY